MNITTLKRLTGVFALSIFSLSAFAQDDIDNLLNENIDDSRKIIGAYISPFMKSISLGLNQGWYNTAKPHKLIGIDITVTVSAMAIPNKQTFFTPSKLGLTHITLDESSESYPKAPTMFGPDETPTFYLKDDQGVRIPGSEFEGPPGLGMKDEIGRNIMPVPMAHLGIGLPKGTDLKLRFIPTIDLGDEGSLKMFGIGVMHDIKQHIPGIKLLPFDLSAFIGYSRFDLEYNFEEGEISGENQRSEFSIRATTIQGVISKKFSVVTLYGGLGYNIAKSNIGIKGFYDWNENGQVEKNERNPIDLDYAASGPRVTAGFRLKLAILTLHADYTLQKYNALTAGIGLSIR